MNENPYPTHGLKGKLKEHVFDALFQIQQGKCFICGFKAELNLYPNNPDWIRNRNIHYLLYIDHCHKTGMVRGLLCQPCNSTLGDLENYWGKPKPDTLILVNRKGEVVGEVPFSEEEFIRICERVDTWLAKHRTSFFLYMQTERWLPRKDILFHMQERGLL